MPFIYSLSHLLIQLLYTEYLPCTRGCASKLRQTGLLPSGSLESNELNTVTFTDHSIYAIALFDTLRALSHKVLTTLKLAIITFFTFIVKGRAK